MCLIMLISIYTWLDLGLLVLCYTWSWHKECVFIQLYWFLDMHNVMYFQCKWACSNEMSLFVTIFYVICAYDPILSTSDVLTPISFFFPNFLDSDRWRVRDHIGRKSWIISPSVAMSSSPTMMTCITLVVVLCYSLKTIISFYLFQDIVVSPK